MPFANDSLLTVDYRLPVTVIRMSTDTVTTTNRLDRDNKVSRVRKTAVTIGTTADPRYVRTLEVNQQSMHVLKVGLELRPDGRLSSVSSTDTDHRAEVLTAVLTTGVSLASAVIPIVATLVPGGQLYAALTGMAAAAIAGGGAVGSPAGRLKLDVNPEGEDLGFFLKQPSDVVADARTPALFTMTPLQIERELGIPTEYYADRPVDYATLVQYRVDLALISLAHARSAPAACEDPTWGAGLLGDLEKILKSVRREAAYAERAFDDWRKAQISERTEHDDFRLFVDQLPTTAELKAGLNSSAGGRAEPVWRSAFVGARMAVTCDFESPDEFADDPARRRSHAGEIERRVPVPARLSTWTITRAQDTTLEPELSRTDWTFVTHPRAVQRVRLAGDRHDGADDLAVQFDDAGALTKISSTGDDSAGSRAKALAALPAALKDAAGSGQSVAAALSLPAARAAALKQRVDELTTQRKLAGLLDPQEDPLADLRGQAERAELEARVALAQQAITNPGGIIVLSTVGAASPGAGDRDS